MPDFKRLTVPEFSFWCPIKSFWKRFAHIFVYFLLQLSLKFLEFVSDWQISSAPTPKLNSSPHFSSFSSVQFGSDRIGSVEINSRHQAQEAHHQQCSSLFVLYIIHHQSTQSAPKVSSPAGRGEQKKSLWAFAGSVCDISNQTKGEILEQFPIESGRVGNL